MNFKCKITTDDITHGPIDPSPLEAMFTATDLLNKGYRKTSNAYCIVSRIDRDDWIDVMAKERFCSRADFYNVDGSGVGDQHRDFYVRTHSKDKLTVHPSVLKLMKSY